MNKILYYGTPVILLNSLNEDETVNISPLSSSWVLGDCIILEIGLGATKRPRPFLVRKRRGNTPTSAPSFSRFMDNQQACSCLPFFIHVRISPMNNSSIDSYLLK